MDEVAMSIQAKLPAIDKVIDHYYTLDEDTDWSKVVALRNVMKSAINITKSKTGEAILKTNRVERARLKHRIETVRREKTSAEAMVNRDKIVFKAQYAKWLDNDKALPKRIKIMRDKYKRIRNEMRSRKKERTLAVTPVFKTDLSLYKKVNPNPFAATARQVSSSKITEDLMPQLRAQNYLQMPSTNQTPLTLQLPSTTQTPVSNQKLPTLQIHSTYKTPSSKQKPPILNEKPQAFERRVLSGGRQIASRENVSRRQIALWRENTFNMDGIRDMLVEQDLRQQSMYCKLQINNYKQAKREREYTSHDKFKLTTALAIERQKSASTISELHDSRPPSIDSRKCSIGLPSLGSSPSKHGLSMSLDDVRFHRRIRQEGNSILKTIEPFQDMRLRHKQVTFHSPR